MVMRVFKFRPIDRAIVLILATLFVVNGLYLVGPWYKEQTNGNDSPIYGLFSNPVSVVIFGSLLVINGFVLFWTAHRKTTRKAVLSTALMAGFLLRLYSLIGVFIANPQLLPPTYTSHAATVLILSAMWVHVKFNDEGPIQ